MENPTENLKQQTQRLRVLQLERARENLEATVGGSGDVYTRALRFPDTGQRAYLVYIKEMVDPEKVSREILRPLAGLPASTQKQLAACADLQAAIGRFLTSASLMVSSSPEANAQALMVGEAVLLVEGYADALLLNVRGKHFRHVGETQIENVLRGPLEGFVENLDANLALIRRRLKDQTFRVDMVAVGRRTKTRVAICSILDIVNPDILARVHAAVESVDVDGILDSGELANYMHPGSVHIFPLALSTERPDHALMSLLEGRVVLVVDGSPLCLVLPAVYNDFFRAMEDFYLPWVPAALLRFLRNIADHLMGLAPAIYVALASYNPGIMQPQFLDVLAATRARLPYPPLVEALMGLFLADIIVEASIRSPKVVGSAVPIVGGIIIGSVLTQTHLVSQVMVVVAALTAISQLASIAEPTMQIFGRFNKYWFLIWTGAFGFLGLMAAATIELAYIASLNSVAVPYFSPIAPLDFLAAIDAKFGLPARVRPRRLRYLNPLDEEHVGPEGSEHQGSSGS